ncbi:MAG: HdeD family acid-resistance protein [Dehalococcoidia bacterium]
MRGIVAVLFGLGAFTWPGVTLGVLIILFGAYALADGIIAIVCMFSGGDNDRWWVYLLEGVAGIGAGLIAFFWPGLTAVTLVFIIAAWAIMTGVFEIIAAIRLRQEIEGEWAFVVSGLLSLVFGALLITRPGAGALAVIWIIGAYALAFGVLLIMLSLKIKKMGKALEEGAAPV